MSEEAFLSRWSRLKRSGVAPGRGGAAPVPVEDRPPAPPAETAGGPRVPDAARDDQPPSGQPPSDQPPPDLPPVESLTAESDFTAFLREGVPEALQRQALRKLWASDPVFANLDGLVDYAEDYNAMFSKTDTVKTLFRVGKGMLDAAEAEAERAEAAEAAQAQAEHQAEEASAAESEDVPQAAAFPSEKSGDENPVG